MFLFWIYLFPNVKLPFSCVRTHVHMFSTGQLLGMSSHMENQCFRPTLKCLYLNLAIPELLF